MNITFPHMGSTYIPIKSILDELNIEVTIPPKSNKRALEIGTKCSPEGICVPFKLLTGNLIEGIRNGADTVFMLTGCGPCRFGIFHAVQEEIIKDMNIDVEFITADRFSSLEGLMEFANRLKEASPNISYLKLFNSIRKSLKVLDAVDEFHDLTNELRCREVNTGQVDRIYASFEEMVKKTHGYDGIMNVLKEHMNALKGIEIDDKKDCLRIGIVGEIYTIIETFINLNIERKLGHMGVEVHRSTSTSEFVREQLDFIPFLHSNKKKTYKLAHKYMETPIGGHAINTIGNIVNYSNKGYDGIIHLLPFTCMPEIVVQSMLPKIEKEEDLPIMTLVLDEMTGEAGYMTRIEAFVDLLYKRRELKNE